VIRLHRHPLATDLLLTAVLLVFGVASAPGGRARLYAAALVLPLIWRRRAPFAVFCVIAAVAFAQWLADLNLSADSALLVAIYTVAVQEPRGRVIAACALLEIGIVLAVVRWAQNGVVAPLVLLTGMGTAAVVLGLNVRTRRAHTATLEERAAQAERARIAREMHDIVAHNLSVMIALADGASYMAGSDPDRSVGAMEQVSQTGRHALSEMRRLLGVLRDDEAAALAPQPGLADLEALLERVRAAGLPVRLESTGAPVALGAGAELTVYRLVQEALTNTLKHAGPNAQATVRLHYDADGVDVEVRDDGEGRARVAAGGQGLAGMRERAAVYGGALEAGPAPGGGWRVRTRLGSAA
jgi:signal transduction histidine kinase